MFETLFGAEMPLAMRFFIAFIVVLALIGAFFWVMRRFGAERLGAGANRSRQPRLAVIDAAAVDSRRRLVLIRRDNVEHLLMIGGPSDVVVEANIVRAAAPQRDMPAPRTAAPAELLPRPVPLAEPGWPPQPEPARPAPRVVEEPAPWSAEPEPAPPPVEPPVRRPEPVARLQRSQESALTSFSSDLNVRPAAGDIGAIRPAPIAERIPASERRSRLAERIAAEPTPAPERPPAILERMPERAPAPERMTAPDRVAPPVEVAPAVERPVPPPAAAPAPAAEPLAASADQNLAEMAQRLEAALRRPSPAEPRPERRPAAEPVPVAEEPAAAPAADRPVPPSAAERPVPPPAAEPRPKPKTLYDSLEQEMASLLGRPSGKP